MHTQCQVSYKVFKPGDKVFCHRSAYTEQGEVVDVWCDGTLIMVEHGDAEFAYSPAELSLIPEKRDSTVVLVNFKTKKRFKI